MSECGPEIVHFVEFFSVRVSRRGAINFTYDKIDAGREYYLVAR